MGGDGPVAADKSAWRSSPGRPAYHQRHHPCPQGGLPLARLPRDLWPSDDDLQSLQSLGGARHLAQAVCRAGRGRGGRSPDDRQHHRQGAPLGGGRKSGADNPAVALSRGGRTTKIHAVVDGCGRPLALRITLGQRGDAPVARVLIEPLPPARLCAADAAYDSDALRLFLIARGTRRVIPNNPTRKRTHPFDRQAYRLRNAIERMFCRLKDWRRIATRYDKLATNFEAATFIAAAITWSL